MLYRDRNIEEGALSLEEGALSYQEAALSRM
jgi:hypothetical protein